MVSAVLTERRHSQGFIVSESPGEYSRDQGTILQQSSNFQSSSSPILPAGLILGKATIGLTATSAAQTVPGANTGNGTMSAITVAAGAVEGLYAVTFLSPTEFEVFNPAGQSIGEGRASVAFLAGGIGFTFTAGGTAVVAGDGFVITMAAVTNPNTF